MPNPAEPEEPSPISTARSEPIESGQILASPASTFRTLGAWLVDLTILLSIVTIYLLAASSLSKAAPPAGLSALDGLLFKLKGAQALLLPGIGLTVLLSFVYSTAFALLWKGRTPGRRVLGLHLVDATGRPPAPARALLRAGFSLLSFALFLTGFWLALFDRKGQTLHDKLAATFVVRLNGA